MPQALSLWFKLWMTQSQPREVSSQSDALPAVTEERRNVAPTATRLGVHTQNPWAGFPTGLCISCLLPCNQLPQTQCIKCP